MTNTDSNLLNITKNAKKAAIEIASLSTETKNLALLTVAQNIETNKERIFEANKKDLELADKLIKEGKLSQSLYSRLALNESKIKDMIQGIKDVAQLEDPINKTQWAMEIDKGLELYRVSCPIGVIGVIFEARPEVVAQISALAIKSSNAVILKGGTEAAESNQVIFDIITEALYTVKQFPLNSINLIKTREDVAEMLKMDDYIDLIIPRGSNALVKYIQSNTKIPVLGHADGICHIYIDDEADLTKAIDICVDSKIQYPSACNAVETILINKNTDPAIVIEIIKALQNNSVTVKGDDLIRKIYPNIEQTTKEDWLTEYSDKIVSIKVVNNIIEAINHINTYGSGHTDAIITENPEKAKVFMDMADSAGVYHNASTRFADGFRYGLGAEVGISTNKTHARGPVGLEGLSIYKYKLFGNGQIVADYCGDKAKPFTHKRLI